MRRYGFTVLLGMFILYTACPAHAAPREAVPVSVSITLLKAQQMADQGNVEEAVHMLTEFQNKKNDVNAETAEKKGYSHYYIDYMLGNYLLMLSQTEKAVARYQAAVKQQPDFSEAWLNLAKCYYDMDKMKPAADAFLKGYKTGSPGKAPHLYYSAVCYAAAEDYQTAYALFRQLLKAHPEEIELEWKETLVQILLTLNKPVEALPYIEELAEKTIGKKQKEWREVLLYQYISLNMDAKALSYARWLTQVDTLEPKWWKALAHLNLQKDRYREGQISLLAYSFLTPLTSKEASLMADIYMALGIPVEAVKYYETPLKDSLDPKTVKKIVQGYMQLYDYDTALVWLDKGLKNKKTVKDEMLSDLLMFKGSLLFETGRFSEAVTFFNQMHRDGHESGQSLLMLGYAAWNAGRITTAKEAFQKAEKHEGQKKAAEKALRELAPIRRQPLIK